LIEVGFQSFKELSAQAVASALGPTLWIAALPGLEWLQISQPFLCSISDGFTPRFGHFPLRVHLMFWAQDNEAQPWFNNHFSPPRGSRR
jgi:hypothetical protein